MLKGFAGICPRYVGICGGFSREKRRVFHKAVDAGKTTGF